MRKYLLVLFFMTLSLGLHAQTSPVSVIRVSNATTLLGNDVPLGTLVVDILNNRMYLTKASVDGGQSINTAINNFELLRAITAPELITVDYTALASNETLFIDASSGSVTITLPLAPVNGKVIIVKKVDTVETHFVTVIGDTGVLIDGGLSLITSVPFQGWVLQSDGTNWFIIGNI